MISHLIRIHLICIFISYIFFLSFKFPSDTRNMESVSAKIVRRCPSDSQTFVQAIFTVISEFSLIWWLQKFSAAQGWCYINIKLATGRFHFANFQSIVRVSIFRVKLYLWRFQVSTWVYSKTWQYGIHIFSRNCPDLAPNCDNFSRVFSIGWFDFWWLRNNSNSNDLEIAKNDLFRLLMIVMRPCLCDQAPTLCELIICFYFNFLKCS